MMHENSTDKSHNSIWHICVYLPVLLVLEVEVVYITAIGAAPETKCILYMSELNSQFR